MPVLVVTNEEAALLRRVLDQFPQTAGNPRIRQDTERSYDDRQDFQAPEVYVGYPTTAGGIPALSAGATPADDIPGTALCTIYRLLISSPTSPSMLATGMNSVRVYNFSENAFAQEWVILVREKFGAWLVAGGTIICP